MVRNSVRIERVPSPNSQGATASTIIPATSTARPASTRENCDDSIIWRSVFREKALWPQKENQQKGSMSRNRLPCGVEFAADALRHTQDDAAGQGAPKASQPAQHHHLEGDQQTARPARRIEVHP